MLGSCGGTLGENATDTTVAAATASGEDRSADTVDVAEWLDVFADYPRYLHHRRRLAVVVTNLGATELTVTDVRLDADHFSPLPGEEKSARLAPGAQVALQVDFGTVDCDDVDALDAAVELELIRERESTPGSLRLPLASGPLDEIRDIECGRQRVDAAVDISFGPIIETEGLQLVTELLLTRGEGTQPVTIRNMRGSVLIGLTALEPAPLTLAEGVERVTFPVQFEAIRCDPHAVGQATKPLEVTLFVAVGDAPPQYVPLVPAEPLRSELRDLIARCVESQPGP